MVGVITSDLKAQTTPALIISKASLSINEGGDATFEVRLNNPPAGGNVTVFVDPPQNSNLTVSPIGHVFSNTNLNQLWNVDRTFTVSAGHDNNIHDETLNLLYSTTHLGGEFDGLSGTIPVTVNDDDDPPLVDFLLSSSTAAENVGTHQVRVELDPAPQWITDVSYTIAGTADEGPTGDFTIANSGTIEVGATAASVTIPVVIIDDTDDDDDETIVLTLTSTNSDNYDLQPTGTNVYLEHTITITDNDMPTNNAPTVANAIVDQTATTGTAFNFPFPANTFTDADSDPLTYTATQSDGTALPSWLTFTANTRTFSGTPAAADAGTLTVRVTANDGNMGTVYNDFDIMVNKPVVNITRDAVSVNEGTAASFTVSRTGPTTAALEVLLSVSEDSTGGRDFVDDTLEVSTMVTIPIGSSSAKFTVATTGDSTDEPNGSLSVALRNSANYTNGVSYVASVTINDNDLPEVSITPGAAVTEGTAATFTVERAGVTTGALTVLLKVSELTTQGQDFVATGDEGDKMVTILAGEDDVTYSVPTTPDTTDEEHGHVTVAIRPSANTYRIDSAKDDADVTVNDNDEPPPGTPVVSITRDASSVIEGAAASFTVTRTLATTAALIVNLEVSEETDDGRNFVANTLEGSKTVTIPVGSSTVKFRVATTGDSTDEPNGEVTVKLLAASNSSGVYTTHNTAHTATVTVNDNDLPEVSITPGAAVTEGTDATFTVERVGDTTGALTVKLTVSENNAGGREFVAASDEGDDSIDIPAGDSDITYSVPTTPDTTDEPNGKVTVSIRASVATYRIDSAKDNADVTVNDNDGTTTNTAPTVANAIPDQTATVGTAFSYTWQTSTFTDPDGNSLSYTVTKPSWLNYDSTTQTFSVTLQTAHIGTHTVTVSASDGTLSVTDSFDITVSASPPPNTAPKVANAIEDQTATPGTLFSLNIAGNFTDADGDTLTYSATQSDGTDLPSWLSLSPAGVFTGTPPEDFTSITVSVTATDPDGEPATDEFIIGQPTEETTNVDDGSQSETEGTSDSLVHFGRTLGVQAVNTIHDRLSAPRQFGLTGQVAGQTLSNGQRPNQQQNTLSTNPPKHTPGGADPLGEDTTIATDTLQTGTAFTYTEETPHGTTISYWGQGTRSSFASENITDGKVTTLAFGTDWHKDKRTYGLMLARSSGDIEYRQGSIERTMTTRMRAIIPYGGMELANNLSL